MANTLNDLIIEPVHPHIGARISGVDLTQSLDNELFDAIRRAFDRYSVLILNDQAIDDDQQVAFSARFGQLEKISFSIAAQNPHVYHLSNVDDDGRILAAGCEKRRFLSVNARWHTDSSFKPVPALASILSGREIPTNERADTEFASMRVGYQLLPAPRKAELRGLVGVHHYAYSLSKLGGQINQAELDALPPCPHPIVRIHPGTGEPSLFVSGHIEAIEGLSEQAGQALAEELIEWCTRDEYVYAHEWRTNDLVIWDNRCVLHRATVIPEREIRRAHRTTVIGEGEVVPFI